MSKPDAIPSSQIELLPLAVSDTASSSGTAATVVTVDQDEEMYCPVCSYNLSGVVSGRCPECGSIFSRDALIRAQQANAITLIPWDNPEEMPLKQRLFHTLRISLVNAEAFSFAFSVTRIDSRAASFFGLCLLAGSGLGLLTALLYVPMTAIFGDAWSSSSDVLELSLGVALFIPVTVSIATILCALHLWFWCPHFDGRRHFRPWLNICAYATAHFLIVGIAVPFSILTALVTPRPGNAEFIFVVGIIWLACILLYTFTMNAVISCRTPGLGDPKFTILVVAAIHLATMLVCGIAVIAITPDVAQFLRTF